jgi:hypothetical protein
MGCTLTAVLTHRAAYRTPRSDPIGLLFLTLKQDTAADHTILSNLHGI